MVVVGDRYNSNEARGLIEMRAVVRQTAWGTHGTSDTE
jgi:hypothetical protein